MHFVFFFFFSSRRRHTRCSRDWSSDVCSSDLGTFERSFTLPATVDASNIKASYEHGVLTVTLPSVGAQRAAPLCVKEIPQLCFHLGVRDGRRARFARRAQQLHLDV